MSSRNLEGVDGAGNESRSVRSEKYMPVMFQESNHDDEINLIDLWLILVKRKQVLLYTVGLCVALGLLYVVIKPDVYRYFASIEIGVMSHGSERIFIEQPESV
ncbi:MAG TPA: Wzz/FepE/Etk N-terminal domain-containing protein, partial [Gammaproteobacteria bacterium]